MKNWNNKKWNITSRIRRVLLDVAVEGPSTGYEVATRTEMPRSSAYDALNQMQAWNWLTAHKIQNGGRVLAKKTYSLTVLGFSHALRLTHFDQTEAWRLLIEQEKDLREGFSSLKEAALPVLSQLQNIIGRWGDLIPLVLGKWGLFEEAGVAAQAIIKLNSAALDQAFREGGPTSWIDLYPSSDPVEVFTYDFYNPFSGNGNRTARGSWAVACAGDPEVRDYLIERLKRAIERYESSAREVESMMQVLQGAETGRRE